MNLLRALLGRTSQPKLRQQRRMRLENLEDRQLMTINPGLMATQADTAYELAPIASEGSINFNANTGAVSVNGKDNYTDRVTISRDWKGTLSSADDTLKVYLTNIGTPLFGEFKYTSVKRVFVNTYGGADTIDNQSATPMTAYGGQGIDVILGGSSGDSLLGGDNDDYLDGRGAAITSTAKTATMLCSATTASIRSLAASALIASSVATTTTISTAKETTTFSTEEQGQTN